MKARSVTLHQTDSSGCKCQLWLMSCSVIIEKSASSFLSHHLSQAVHSQSVYTHTHTHTVLNLITACTGGGVCFSSSRDEVEGGMEGTARSRLSLYLHEQRASINSTTPPPQSWSQLQSDCVPWRLCDANEVEVLDPSGSYSPRSSGFGRDAATLWTSSSLSPDMNLHVPDCCYHKPANKNDSKWKVVN